MAILKPCENHRCNKHDLSILLFTKISKVSADEWDSCIRSRSIFLNRDYLASIESSHIPVCHVMFKSGDQPVGAASFQVTDFVGAPLQSYLNQKNPVLSFITRSIKLIKKPMESKVVVCGSPFSSGEHGYAFSEAILPSVAAAALADASRLVKTELDKTTPTAGVLLKEFYPTSQSLVESLTKNRYSQFQTEPAMVLPIDKDWRGFDDYLTFLASKYRVKAKRTYVLSKALVQKDLTLGDLSLLKNKINELYDAVANRAEYRLGKMDFDTLIELRGRLKTKFVFKGYFYDDKLVGFLMGFVNGDTLEAGFVGIDYSLNRAHAVYPRMLYDYLQIAMDLGLSAVNYGRTSEEIKSSLGAVPVQMCCCLHLGKTALNTMLPMLSESVILKDVTVRKPFKKSWYTVNEARIMDSLMGGALSLKTGEVS